MKNYTTPENRTAPRIPLIAWAAAAAVALALAAPPAHADHVTPPPVPDDIKVPVGNKAFLVGHAFGTQNYICLPSGAGFKFVLFTPQATLLADNDKQVITHFFSPNLSPIPPEILGTIRATWQHSRDGSIVWGGQAVASPVPDAIAWLRLPAAGVQEGPTGGHTLTATTFIQRLNTSGGVAPPTGCDSLADVGHQAFVPYTADYFFYKKAPEHDAGDGN